MIRMALLSVLLMSPPSSPPVAGLDAPADAYGFSNPFDAPDLPRFAPGPVSAEYPGEIQPRDPRHLRVRMAGDVPGVDRERLRQIASRMNAARLTAPEGRLRHFRRLRPERFPDFAGWDGTVLRVDAIPGGDLVHVRVTAGWNSSTFGGGETSERYFLAGCLVHLLDVTADSGQPRLLFHVDNRRSGMRGQIENFH